ncbi:hypothetical protein D3C77_48770 [compost metagenome]
MLTKYLKKKVRDYCDKAYPAKLVMVADDRFRPLFNNACHYNADALVRQGDAVAIIECLMIFEGNATLHYVSLRSDLKAFDATLGPLWAGEDYRLIEVLRSMPSDDPYERLRSMKKKIAKAAGVPAAILALLDDNALL